jgi:hypothetical protein
VGTFIPPNEEQRAKGFLGYSKEVFEEVVFFFQLIAYLKVKLLSITILELIFTIYLRRGKQ